MRLHGQKHRCRSKARGHDGPDRCHVPVDAAVERRERDPGLCARMDVGQVALKHIGHDPQRRGVADFQERIPASLDRHADARLAADDDAADRCADDHGRRVALAYGRRRRPRRARARLPRPRPSFPPPRRRGRCRRLPAAFGAAGPARYAPRAATTAQQRRPTSSPAASGQSSVTSGSPTPTRWPTSTWTVRTRPSRGAPTCDMAPSRKSTRAGAVTVESLRAAATSSIPMN